MRFGGHESFAVREGWLSRGLEILCEQPALLVDEFAEDHLGVGRNMAKSIRHWLQATGLAHTGSAEGTLPTATPLGRLIHKKDPHLMDTGSWWTLHINLINNPESAFTWNWFFNQWALQRFDRSPCIEGLRRFATATLPRVPASRTLERDVATLLQSYARPIPAVVDDPEDSSDSPFQDLNLLLHFGASGYYQFNFDPKPIPRGVFGYAVARFASTEGRTDFSLTELERSASAPGRAFVLRGDDLFDLLLAFEEQDKSLFAMRAQAGERAVRVAAKKDPLDWLKMHYAEERTTAHA